MIKNWTKSDLRFCKNKGSKRAKINEQGGQLDGKSYKEQIDTNCLKSFK